MKHPDLTHHKLLKARFKKKNRFFDSQGPIFKKKSIFRQSFICTQTSAGFFQGFPRELNFNILKHVITHLYKHIGEEIVW